MSKEQIDQIHHQALAAASKASAILKTFVEAQEADQVSLILGERASCRLSEFVGHVNELRMHKLRDDIAEAMAEEAAESGNLTIVE